MLYKNSILTCQNEVKKKSIIGQYTLPFKKLYFILFFYK